MFGLGIWEIVVILAVALIVLGPRRLPGMARQLGRALREFRRATNELRYSIDEATAEREPPVKSPYSESTEVVTSKQPATATPRVEPPGAANSEPPTMAPDPAQQKPTDPSDE